MTTENGVQPPRKIRAAINTLDERRIWLLGRIDAAEAVDAPTEFFRREVAAIELALPALEAEWADAVRLWREYGLRHVPT